MCTAGVGRPGITHTGQRARRTHTSARQTNAAMPSQALPAGGASSRITDASISP
jgi:hypothetical protein